MTMAVRNMNADLHIQQSGFFALVVCLALLVRQDGGATTLSSETTLSVWPVGATGGTTDRQQYQQAQEETTTGRSAASRRMHINRHLLSHFPTPPARKRRIKQAQQMHAYTTLRGNAPPHFTQLNTTIIHQLPPGQRHRLAIITVDTGDYDHLRLPLPHVDNVSFFLFVDRNIRPVKGWNIVRLDQHPYYLTDTASDFHLHLSFSNRMTMPKEAFNDMIDKYFKTMAWRVPELQPFRYIMYMDGNVQNIDHSNIFTSFMSLKPQGRFFSTRHPEARHGSIVEEAKAAVGEERYKVDHVTEQARYYVQNYGYPDADPQKRYDLRWTGFFVYDAWDVSVRQLLTVWWREIQMWSLECQVALPFALWKSRFPRNKDAILPAERMCELIHITKPVLDNVGYCRVQGQALHKHPTVYGSDG